MRILLVIDTLELGGAERHTVNLGVALRNRGHRISVACSAGGQLYQELCAAGIRVHQLQPRPVKRRLSMTYCWRLRRLLKKERPDVLHAHCFASMAAATLATWGLPIALVLTEHSEARWQTAGLRWLNRRLHRRAHGSIAVSASIARRLWKSGTQDVQSMLVIHNAIPQDYAGRTARALSRHQMARPRCMSGTSVVGVIARLQREKGVHVFLEALARLPDVHGLILGDGPERSSLVEAVSVLGLHGRVRFLPPSLPSGAMLRRLDVLAVPSLTEGSPLVVLEAMTAGVPLVASQVGGIPELILNGEHGVLVSPGDSEALAIGIRRLLAQNGLAQRLSAAAQRRVGTTFPFDGMVRATERVYQDAVARIRT